MLPYCLVQRNNVCKQLSSCKGGPHGRKHEETAAAAGSGHRIRLLTVRREARKQRNHVPHLMVGVASDNLVQIPDQRQRLRSRDFMQIIQHSLPDAAPDLPSQHDSQRGGQNSDP